MNEFNPQFSQHHHYSKPLTTEADKQNKGDGPAENVLPNASEAPTFGNGPDNSAALLESLNQMGAAGFANTAASRVEASLKHMDTLTMDFFGAAKEEGLKLNDPNIADVLSSRVVDRFLGEVDIQQPSV